MLKGKLKSWFVKYLILSLMLWLAFFVHTTPALADSLNITVGSEFTVDYGGGGGAYRQFPAVWAWNDDVFVSFSQHNDTLVEHPTDGMKISRNDGSTWPTYIQNQDFWPISMTKLSDGSLFSASYISYAYDNRHSTNHFWKSTDNGATWTHSTGTVTYPKDIAILYPAHEWGGPVFYKGLIQMNDGSLRAVTYGYWNEDYGAGKSNKYMCAWIKSTDGGANWSYVSEVAHSDTAPGAGYCEPTVARCADGSLLCVMRTSGGTPMYQCRSTDDGATWSTPTTLPGMTVSESNGVDPTLLLMSNGTLALSYGDRSTSPATCRMYFSLDGNGNDWSNSTSVFTSTSSAYTGIAEVAQNRLIYVTDKGAGAPSDAAIRGVYVEVVRNTDTMIDTFENDTVGQVSTGYTEAGASGQVSNTRAYGGTKSLRIYDNSSSVLTNVVKTTSASASKILEFKLYVAAVGGAPTISINSGGNTNLESVFHMSFGSNGKIYWYNGSTWTKLSDTVVVPMNAWSTFCVEASNTINANVYVNGVLAGTIGKYNTFSTMDRVRFMSGGTTQTGDDYYVDNVSFN